MGLKGENKYLGNLVLLSVITVCLLVTPFSTNDPANLPKMCILILLSSIIASLFLTEKDFFKNTVNRSALILAGVFLLQLCLALIVDTRTFSMKFYGTSGRNTGFISYLCLTVILVAAMVSVTPRLISQYVGVLICVGFILGIYGLIQSNGYDFYEFMNIYGSNVFGTFGNPNFQSAFMGMVAAAALTLATLSSFKLGLKILLYGLVGISIFNISVSSQQGYFNFLAGFATAVSVYFFMTKRVTFGWLTMIFLGSGFMLVLLGIFDKGPLADAIFKSSLQARRFYWQGAINMLFQHPVFGVGLDGFGDWYRRSRTLESIQFNPGLTADTAHNIPLDIGSGGGIPLVVFYLLIIIYTVISMIRTILRQNDFDIYFATLVAVWTSYQAQSLISINQLGIGVWGWSLSGLIIGYELRLRRHDIQPSVRAKLKSKKRLDNYGKSAVTIFTGLVIVITGITFATLPYISATKYYQALRNGEVYKLEIATSTWPTDLNRFLYTSRIFQDNNLNSRAIEALRTASKIYPDSFEIWQQWSAIDSASPADIVHAKAEMKRLDPHNPDL